MQKSAQRTPEQEEIVFYFKSIEKNPPSYSLGNIYKFVRPEEMSDIASGLQICAPHLRGLSHFTCFPSAIFQPNP